MVAAKVSMSELAELRATEAEIIEEFGFFDEWADKYKYLIDLGRKLANFPENEKVDANLVAGCQSQVWFISEQRDGRLYFKAASDAAIVSGLIMLLMRVYSGRKPATILAAEPEFISQIGLAQHLSHSRSNGLFSMVRAIKNMAAQAA